MNAGGWPDAGDEWNTNAMTSYGAGPGGSDRGRGYAESGPVYYDQLPYADEPYGEAAHDTMPRGVTAHDALTFGVRFRTADPGLDAAEEEAYGTGWEFEEGLAALLQTSAPEPPAPPAPLPIPRQRYAHRRRPRRLTRVARRVRRLANGPAPSLKLISLLIACVTALIVAVVGALGGLISYDPLRRLAVPDGLGELAAWWPLLVYGPWVVAALSILRAAVHRRRGAHSWAVVVFFSAVAVFLCVAHAGLTPVRLAVSGLPPIAALVCFHQLVRQITLTAPPLNGPQRPRHTLRHR